jgi:multiple sugar transport system substrate-binding protein
MNRKNAQYLYIQLADALREQIVSGSIEPGKFLPSENELAREYGMSRISVRKSLELLVQEGLIVRKMGQGTIVSPHLAGKKTNQRTLRIAANAPSHLVDHSFPWLIREFEKEAPDIKVALLHLPSGSFWESLRRSEEIGLQPDLLVIADQQFKGTNEHEAFAELDKSVRITGHFFYPKLLEVFRHNGVLKAVPVTFSPVFMVYNPMLFDRYGLAHPAPEWKIGDLIETAKRLTMDTNGDGITDQYGISISYSHTRWPVIALQHGVDFMRLEEQGPRLEAALGLIHRMLYVDRCALLHTFTPATKWSDPFLNGKAAMVLTTSLELAHWKQLGIGFEPRICPMFFGPDPSTLLVANGMMIPRGSGEPELAEQFLEFVIRPDIQEQLLRRFGFLSVLKPVNDQVLDRAYLEAANVADRELKDCRFRTDIFPDPERIEELDRRLGLFWSGLESVASVVEGLKKQKDSPARRS